MNVKMEAFELFASKKLDQITLNRNFSDKIAFKNDKGHSSLLLSEEALNRYAEIAWRKTPIHANLKPKNITLNIYVCYSATP